MTTHKEALTLALEALENLINQHYAETTTNDDLERAERAITAIKEALAEPEQEPTNLERHERNVQKFLGTQQPKEPEQEPLETPLPCDVTVGHVTLRKGVALSTLVARMQVLYDMAQASVDKPKEPEHEPVAWGADQAYAEGRGDYEVAQIRAKKTGWKLFGELSPKEQSYWVAKAAFNRAATPPQPKEQEREECHECHIQGGCEIGGCTIGAFGRRWKPDFSEHTEKPKEPEQEPVAKAMTAHRAAYFMERFKHEEKLLGPNEQAALDFVISMLEAQPAVTEQHKQEPVAHVCVFPLRGDEFFPQTRIEWKNGRPVAGPLYTTPPQRKPLTDEQIRQIMQSLGWTGEAPSDIEFSRAIEAAHGIKGEA